MSFFSAVWGGVVWVFSMFFALFAFLWFRLLDWLFLFIAPIRDFNTLWLLIPVWLSWITGEFFQEKNDTSFGNAISNGVVPVWAAIDWTRYIFTSSRGMDSGVTLFIKLFICAAIFTYGMFIIIDGTKTKAYIHYFGRIREVTYVILVFTPIIYGIVDMSWNYMFGIIVFFPIFYYLIEWIDSMIPDPKAITQDNEDAKK